jgi:hypothetical protein
MAGSLAQISIVKCFLMSPSRFQLRLFRCRYWPAMVVPLC